MEFVKNFSNWENVEEHPAGSVIFPQGIPAQYLYVVLSGEVELSLNGEALGVEKTEGIIGEMALFESAKRSAMATALTDVRLARLERDQLTAMMQESAEFSLQIMTILANRLRVVNQHIKKRTGPASSNDVKLAADID